MKTRVIATLLAAVLVTAGACARPVRLSGAAAPIDETPSATSSPSATVTASVNKSAATNPPGPEYVLAPVVREPVTGMPSRYYGTVVNDSSGMVQLQYVSAGKTTSLAKVTKWGLGLTMSPDGAWITWNVLTGDNTVGDQWIAQTDGTDAKVLLHDVVMDPDSVPVWTPDSRHLLLRQGSVGASREIVDIRDGSVHATTFARIFGSIVFSPSGDCVAYVNDRQVVVAKPTGQLVSYVAVDSDDVVQGVSDDGRQVIVAPRQRVISDVPAKPISVVDMKTWVVKGLPASVTSDPDGALAVPLPGGYFLVRGEFEGGFKLIVADSALRPKFLSPLSLVTSDSSLMPYYP